MATRLPKKEKGKNQQSTRWWLLLCSSFVRWSAWIPALKTNKRVHRVWTNSTINQIVFLQPGTLICCTRQHCGLSAVSPHLAFSYTGDGRRMCKMLLDLLLWLFMSPVCLCANEICNRRWLAMLDCFQTLNNNKINYVCPRIGTLLILTVSQLAKPLTYSWLTENVKRYKKRKRVILIPQCTLELDASSKVAHNVWLIQTWE